MSSISLSQLELCADALKKNGFDAVVVDSPHSATQHILDHIVPVLQPKVVSYADSMTLHATAVLDAFKDDADIVFIDTFEPGVDRETILERRRHALLSDLFFTGTNALTQTGVLVNLDMVGNRTAALNYGPRHLVLTVGKNKIVPDIEAAQERIKTIAAPENAKRHNFKTPCTKTGVCMECKSPQRICNTWTITERSYPKGRITVILIDEEIGL
ncbi:lactate utilization protein [Desulfovibrio inopinatus]|uniref:lactate utilization protein n=1 Tax=Desulfovibrio inopinatus TaxID=102109 RepID=UPI00040220D6|nr:lactate utilization protein [Desulfovibrio inopinatus]